MEPNTWGERLDLLTVLRGLESLDQPSRVTLVGCSRYVEQGILYGLTEWRDNDWRWEYFGQMAPVRDADLWQRMDRVLQIHQVDCQRRRFDQGHDPVVAPHWNIAKGCKNWVDRIVEGEWVKCYAPQAAARCMVWKDTALRLWHKMLEFKGLGFRVQGSGFRT